jgi:uncharacterized protein YbjT (DUF2867 family)
MDATVHVIGAGGRSGEALVRALMARGTRVVPVVRDLARWQAAAPPVHPLLSAPRLADLTDAPALRAALGDATRIVSTARAWDTEALLAAAPPEARLVQMGSTRRFTRWPDEHARGVAAGEAALLASGRSGVMLHPTMIYGAPREANLRRLAALLRRLPVVPLPGGGRALVQPIHQDDITLCLIAAIGIEWDGPRALVVAGSEPLPYAELVRAVAAAAGLPRPRILPVPSKLLLALAPLTRRLPFLPSVGADEVRRLAEDKAFDIAPMVGMLGVRPIPLSEGLARAFSPGGTAAWPSSTASPRSTTT